MHRGGCAFLPSVWMEQTFSVETEITRLLGFWFGFFFARSQKNGFFYILEKETFSLAALPRDPNSWTGFTLTWLLE